MQVVAPEILRIFPVPLGALLPVPLLFAVGVSTGPLAISKSWVRGEPTAANTARTLSHRFLSDLGGLRRNDSKTCSANKMLGEKEPRSGGSKNRWAKSAQQRSRGSGFHRWAGPFLIGGDT